jgi:hypothetical protein
LGFDPNGGRLLRESLKILASTWILTSVVGYSGSFEHSNMTGKLSLMNGASGLQLLAKNPNSDPDHPSVEPISFQPNSVGSVGYSLSYKSFGIGYEKKGGTDEQETIKKGYSENVRYSFFYAHHSYAGQAYYYKSKGFYTSTPTIIEPTWTSAQPYPQYASMKVENFGTSWIYAHDEKDFSAEALISQSERFKGGFSDSLLLGFNLGKTIFHDLPQLTVHFKDGSETTLNLSQVESVALSPQIGYGVFLGMFDFYATVSVLAGPSYEASRINGIAKYSIARGTSSKLVAGFGYHSKRLFLTYSLMGDFLTKRDGDLQIEPNRIYNEVALGFHL